MEVHVARRAHHARQGQGAQGDQRKRPHSAHPPERLDQRLRDRREDELPERSARIDDPRGFAAPILGQSTRGGADQHREAAGARTDRCQHAECDDETEPGSHERRQGGADREHD